MKRLNARIVVKWPVFFGNTGLMFGECVFDSTFVLYIYRFSGLNIYFAGVRLIDRCLFGIVIIPRVVQSCSHIFHCDRGPVVGQGD